MSLTVKDLEKLQAHYPDYRMELVHGRIVVMSSSGYESDEVALQVGANLWNWVEPRQLGRITGSSAGFSLANTRAPDVSFVRAERLPRSPRGYATVSPDLMVEVKSPTDRINHLRDKIDELLDQGTVVGILVNPENHTSSKACQSYVRENHWENTTANRVESALLMAPNLVLVQ